MKLHGFGPTRSFRALCAFKKLDADCEFISVNLMADEHMHPDFLLLNPAGKVLVLVDGDRIIPELAAIVLYLADKFPEKGLLPADLAQRAQVYRWIMFAITELEQPLWRISKRTAIDREHRRLPADITLAREEFVATVAILETHLEGRRFIVGDRITAADCVTAYLIDWANELRLIDSFVRLRDNLEQMYQRATSPKRIAAAFHEIRAA